MEQISWTGDPATDQMLMQNLIQQQGQGYYRQKNRLSEELNARGFGGGGVGLGDMDQLMAAQAGAEGQLQTGAAQAHVGRIQAEKQREQDIQNQMRVTNYGAQLGQKKKMTPTQRALLYGGSGAVAGGEIGSLFPGYGTAIGAGVGGIGGALYGYFGGD